MTILQFLDREADKLRAKRYAGCRIQWGCGDPPHLERCGGFTKWKNHKPVKYFQVQHSLIVGDDWLVQRFPITWLVCQLRSEPFDVATTEIVFADLYNWKPSFGWPDEAVSMDEEGDRLYA